MKTSDDQQLPQPQSGEGNDARLESSNQPGLDTPTGQNILFSEQLRQMQEDIDQTKQSINAAREKLGLLPTTEDPPSVITDRETLQRLSSDQDRDPTTAEGEEANTGQVSTAIDIPTPDEEKETVIKEAMDQFDELLSETGQLKQSDTQMILELQKRFGAIARDTLDQNPNRAGFRKVNTLATQFADEAQARLTNLKNETEEFGLSFPADRQIIERLLKGTSGQDGEKIQENVQQAITRFVKTLDTTKLSRYQLQQQRLGIRNFLGTSTTASQSALLREEMGTTHGLEGSLVDEYSQSLRRLNNGFYQDHLRVNSRENQLVDNNEQRLNLFRLAVEKLLPQQHPM